MGLVANPKVVTLGEAMLRLSPPAHGRLELTDALELHVAGSEANVASGLAALGFRASWVSRLPDSPLGRRVARELAGSGVEVCARFVDGRLGLFFVEFGQPPRPSRVWYDRANSAAAGMESGDLDESVLDDASYAVVSGITSALSPSAHALALRFADAARAKGAVVCVDVNYRERLWSPEEARGPLAELAGRADVLVCSARDATRVFGIDSLEALRAELAPSARLVVRTRSTEGAEASTVDGQTVEHAAFPTVVVDRIGAGDAFMVGLVWGLEQGDEAEALRAAAAAAALKCTIAGDRLVATEDELRELLAEPGPKDVVR